MNEVDQVEELIRTHSGQHERWWKRLWRRFERHLERNPTMKGLYVGALFFAIGIGLVFVQSRSNESHARLADKHATAQDLYVAQVVIYTQTVNTYQICLDGVARSDDNRASWEDLANLVASLDTGSGNALNIADQIRHNRLLSKPPRTVDDCVKPGAPPNPPDQ